MSDLVVIEPTTYRTRKAAERHADLYDRETPDYGWRVLQISAKCFAVARPYQDGDERHGYEPFRVAS